MNLQQQFNVENVAVEIYSDKPSLSSAAAYFVADQIKAAFTRRGEANVVFATGASQYDFLAALRALNNVDWSKVTAFHLDEYINLSAQHPASFRRYLQERLFDDLPFRAVHLLEGDAVDPRQECVRYEALLRDKTIDIACIGIGENGHLAFNDPPADFETDALVHVVTLDLACRQQQVGEGHFPTVDDVPAQALSMTIPAILSAEVISCVVPNRRKAEAVRCALEGPVEPGCPASVLRRHPQCRLYLDSGSASHLTLTTKPSSV